MGRRLATITLDGTTLDTWYPAPHLGEPGSDEELATSLALLERVDDARRVRTVVVTTTIDLTAAPASDRRTLTCACTCFPTAW